MKTLTVIFRNLQFFVGFFGRSTGAGSRGNPLKMPRSVSCVPEKQLLVQRRMPVGRRAAFFLVNRTYRRQHFQILQQKNLQIKEESVFFLGDGVCSGEFGGENNM